MYLQQRGLVEPGSVGYSGAVERQRPGIASANRPRSGSFATLIDQVLDDDSALDALTFAYAELEEPDRRALAHAVLQDAQNPTQALLALLAIEESPTLRQRLIGLIGRQGGLDQRAFFEGTEAQGAALLIQSLPGREPEGLRIAWKESKIHLIEIESRTDMEVCEGTSAVAVAEAAETLARLLWQHIRSGGELPPGAERFAWFLSVR